MGLKQYFLVQFFFCQFSLGELLLSLWPLRKSLPDKVPKFVKFFFCHINVPQLVKINSITKPAAKYIVRCDFEATALSRGT